MKARGRRLAKGLGASCLAFLIAACADGGTDEVDNPALNVTLRTAGGQGLTGTVSVFARYQNPTRDSLPVLTLPAGEKGGTVIPAGTLLAAMETASQAGLPWKDRDSVVFNLVGSAGAQEAFRAEYLLLRGAGGSLAFERILPPEGGPFPGGSLSTSLPMAPAVQAYRGTVGADGVALGLDVLFVPGSPYKADVAADGSFSFSRIAAGRYDVRALDGDGKVYGPADSLATDSAFAPADWSEADIIWIGD
jgi:hypothetical protein